VAISTTLYVESSPVIEIVDFVRRHSPDTLVVVGGPHILTLCSSPHLQAQDVLLQRMGADVFINEAQGEQTFARLLTELRKGGEMNLSEVPNLVCRPGLVISPDDSAEGKPPRFLRTKRETENNDMDAEATDWSLLPRELYSPTATMVLSRSCPFNCSFCRYPALAGPFKTVGVETVRREMRQFRDAGVTTLILFDDTPNAPLPRFKAILRMMIEEDLNFRWFSNLRCTNMDPEAYDLMGRSGCQGVFLGIESGDQRILDNMNKRTNIEAYRSGMRRLKDLGILTYASFIVGFPGETAETLENTIRFIEETKPDYYQVHVYYHSKSVPLQEQAGRFGLVGSDYTWSHSTMDWKGACDAADTVRRRVTHSIVGTSYLSTFWMIGYLLGKGVSMEHVHRFMALCAPLLIHNAESWAAETEEDAVLSPELLDVARLMADDLGKAKA
jgi:p-methyltransferase